MNEYSFRKSFVYEQLNLRIEFSFMNNRFIAHKIYKNGRITPLIALDIIETAFYSDCRKMYMDFLDKKGLDYYIRGEE